MGFDIKSEYPCIKEYKNFLSSEECNELIEYAKDSLVPGGVVNEYGESTIDYAHRNAYTTSYKGGNQLIDGIIDRVMTLTNLNKNRFEAFTFIKYNEGQEFKIHQDYFIPRVLREDKVLEDRCHIGGNRTNTIILYLSDVTEGGETSFPWLDLIIKPEKGKLLQFDYSYDDWEANIRSQHAGLPVISGEKWIVTLWVREQDRSNTVLDYKRYQEESDVYQRVTNISYNLEVGPEYDRRTLQLELPGNLSADNTIIVGFTGGMDSSLLLYLLGALNNQMEIPYHIQPVCITGELCTDESRINEDWHNVDFMSEYIADLIGGNIKKIQYFPADPNIIRKSQVPVGLFRFFNNKNLFRHRKNSYIFSGTNEIPNEENGMWACAPERVVKSKHPYYRPFANLQKYHIVDAILQLGLEDIIKYTSKCGVKHRGMDDICISFACNERRWGVYKINKDVYNKHFTENIDLTGFNQNED